MSDKEKTPKSPTADGQTHDFAEREAKIAADEAALSAREAAIAQKEKALADKATADHQARCADFAETLVQSGQVLPSEKTAVVSVLMDASEDKSLDFAESGEVVKKTHADLLKGLLSRLPKVIDFAERTAGDPANRDLPQMLDGDASARAEAEMDKQITAFAEAQGITYAEAAATFEGAY